MLLSITFSVLNLISRWKDSTPPPWNVPSHPSPPPLPSYRLKAGKLVHHTLFTRRICHNLQANAVVLLENARMWDLQWTVPVNWDCWEDSSPLVKTKTSVPLTMNARRRWSAVWWAVTINAYIQLLIVSKLYFCQFDGNLFKTLAFFVLCFPQSFLLIGFLCYFSFFPDWLLWLHCALIQSPFFAFRVSGSCRSRHPIWRADFHMAKSEENGPQNCPQNVHRRRQYSHSVGSNFQKESAAAWIWST